MAFTQRGLPASRGVKRYPGANRLHRERMYKFRVKTWGLRKYWGESLAKDAIQAIQQLESCGTTGQDSSSTAIAAQAQTLRRYLKRNPEVLHRLAREGGSLAVEELLSGVPGAQNRLGRAADRQRRLLQPTRLRAPEQLEIPDEMMRLLWFLVSSESSVGCGSSSRRPEQDEISQLCLRPWTCYRPQPC